MSELLKTLTFLQKRKSEMEEKEARIVPPKEMQKAPDMEPFREQFLNRTITAEHIISTMEVKEQISSRNVSHVDDKVKSIYDRAIQVNKNIRDPRLQMNHQFYAKVPLNNQSNTVTVASNHSSPLLQSNHNSIYSFQATPDTAKEVMIDCNPYSDIPYQVQSWGKKIGADLDSIQNKLHREQIKTEIVADPILQENGSLNPPKTNKFSANNTTQSRKETTEKATQTTTNTGDLEFRISSNDLQNLSKEKQRILLEFMDAFNIRDNSKVSSIKERLDHRMANR